MSHFSGLAGSALWSFFAVALLAGCHASEAPTSEFLPNSARMAKDEALPFNKAYWNKQYDSKDFTEVMIAPVNTDYIMAQNFWEKANTAGVSTEKAKSDVKAMADYTR